MIPRVAIGLIGVALLLSAPCAAMHDDDEPARKPAVQARIERLVETIVAANRGGPEEEIPELAEQLRASMKNDRDSLLQQLAIYLSEHRGNEQTMGTALLIDFFGFSKEEKIASLAPFLGTQNERLLDAMWELLDSMKPTDAEIDELSRDTRWWARFYVAHVFCRHPGLVPVATADRLRSDSDERVHAAVSRCGAPATEETPDGSRRSYE